MGTTYHENKIRYISRFKLQDACAEGTRATCKFVSIVSASDVDLGTGSLDTIVKTKSCHDLVVFLHVRRTLAIK